VCQRLRPDLRRNRLVLVVPRSTRANASLPRPLEDFVPPRFPRSEAALSIVADVLGRGPLGCAASIQRHVGHEVTALAQEESPREADGHAPGRPERK
jgi:hypothetical protein